MSVTEVAAEHVEVLPISEDMLRSVARVTLCGDGRPVRNRVCRLSYEVICGEGEMMVDGVSHDLYLGKVVEVLPGQAYQDRGEVSFLVTSEPPFYEGQVETAEPQF